MKKLFLCLVLLLAVGLVAACGRNGNGDEAADNGNDQPAAETPAPDDTPDTTPDETQAATGIDGIDWDEHVTFTWFMINTPVNDYYTDYSENPVVRYLEHRFNVTFDFQQAPVGTEADHLSLMMGAGAYTDVIHLSPFAGNIPQLYEDGVIIDIAQWLDYMPNKRALLETNQDFARAAFDDEGRILQLIIMGDEPGYSFSGLLYRHDILEAMTDGNVQFPSGNDVPTTIADWEYMLPMFMEFFEMAGFADSAPLIIPASGVNHFGALMNSFGAYHHLYRRGGVVYHGILEPEFRTYIETMADWFQRGWIHQDFASRTTDMFFMPNPPLVFGGAAGSFYGMVMHMGDRMSMPEFGMYFDVRAMPSPMAEGISQQDMLRRREDQFGMGRHSAVSATNPDIGRFLAIMDILYTEYGGMLRALGVSADQIAPHDTVTPRMGMSEGAWWLDAAGDIVIHPYIDQVGGHIIQSAVNAIRLPGLYAQSVLNNLRDPETVGAHAAWTAQCAVTQVHPMPEQLTPTVEEAARIAAIDPHITDIRDQWLVRFITGHTPVNDETWDEFIGLMIDAGVEEHRDIMQAAYDRFNARGQ